MVSGWANISRASGTLTGTKGQGWRKCWGHLETPVVLHPAGLEPRRRSGDDLMASRWRREPAVLEKAVEHVFGERRVTGSQGRAFWCVCGNPVWSCWKQLLAQRGSPKTGGVFGVCVHVFVS